MNDGIFKTLIDSRPEHRGYHRKNIVAEKLWDKRLEAGDVATLTLHNVEIFSPGKCENVKMVLARSINETIDCHGLIAYIEDGKMRLVLRRE